MGSILEVPIDMNMLRACCLIPLLLTSCALLDEDASPGATALFNGRNLDGWTAYSAKEGTRQEEVWSVQDGVIVCKGDPMGWLATTGSFANGRVTLEYRWAPGKEPGNSGIFVRLNGAPKALPRCVEVQLKHGNAGDVFGFHGMPVACADTNRAILKKGHELGGDLSGAKRLRGAERAPGRWNRLEIEISGQEIEVELNGRNVNEVACTEVIGGPIALQSEGGEVHFRNIVFHGP